MKRLLWPVTLILILAQHSTGTSTNKNKKEGEKYQFFTVRLKTSSIKRFDCPFDCRIF